MEIMRIVDTPVFKLVKAQAQLRQLIAQIKSDQKYIIEKHDIDVAIIAMKHLVKQADEYLEELDEQR